jgi:CrcB protein
VSDVWVWLGVGVLGGVGALARFVVDAAVATRARTRFPLGTFGVNVSGALLLGLVTGLALAGDALLLAGTALLGSYTTFSTWMYETQRLVEDGSAVGAALNVLISLALGLGAAAAGRAIGGQL